MHTIPLALKREDFVQTGGYENKSTDPFAESFEIEFKVTRGQRIEKGTIVAEITTSKAIFEVESPVHGTIVEIGNNCVDGTWQYSKRYQSLTLEGADKPFEIMLPHIGVIKSEIEATLGEYQYEDSYVPAESPDSNGGGEDTNEGSAEGASEEAPEVMSASEGQESRHADRCLGVRCRALRDAYREKSVSGRRHFGSARFGHQERA